MKLHHPDAVVFCGESPSAEGEPAKGISFSGRGRCLPEPAHREAPGTVDGTKLFDSGFAVSDTPVMFKWL